MFWKKKKIALLIDGENVPIDDLDLVIPDLEGKGNLVIRRAYFFGGRTSDKQQDVLDFYSIETVGFYNGPRVKNASDFELYIDAVELLHRESIDIFCIVSSDSGFLPLIQYLQDMKKTVWGFGPSKSGKALQRQCDSYTVTRESPQTPKTKPRKRKTRKSGRKQKRSALNKKRQNALVSFVTNRRDCEGWINISTLVSDFFIPRNIDARRQGFYDYSTLLAATSLFHFEDQKVRLKKQSVIRGACKQ